MIRAGLIAMVIVAAAGCEAYEVHGVGWDAGFEFDAIEPGAPLAAGTYWDTCTDSTEVVAHRSYPVTSCDSHDFTASYHCLGVGCVVMDRSGRMCGESQPANPVWLSCGRAVDVIALTEGELTVEARLVDDGDEAGAVIETTWAQRVMAPESLSIAQCGVDYQPADCVYRLPSGAIGVELEIRGQAAGHLVATNADAIGPNPVTCRDRGSEGMLPSVRCLAEIVDPRQPLAITATDGTLEATATIEIPDHLATPDWPLY